MQPFISCCAAAYITAQERVVLLVLMKNFSGVMLAFQFVSVLSAAAAVASGKLKFQ